MINLNTATTTDAVEGMKQISTNSIDLTVTSPPYDNLRDYNGGSFNIKTITEELFRITKPGGVVVWVVADSVVNGGETGTSFRHALQFMDAGFLLNDTMIYMRTGTTFSESGKRYTQMFDYMFIFSKGIPKTFNCIKDVPKLWEGSWGRSSVRQKNGSLRDTQHEKSGTATIRDESGKYGWKTRPNVWIYISGGKFKHPDWDIAKEHPATFPYLLAEDHILSWSNEGDIILDPFCGSGTVGLAAKKNRRNYILFDISKEYVGITEKRLKKESYGVFWERIR